MIQEPLTRERSLEDEVAAADEVESAVEATAPDSKVPQETEPQAVDEMVQRMERIPGGDCSGRIAG